MPCAGLHDAHRLGADRGDREAGRIHQAFLRCRHHDIRAPFIHRISTPPTPLTESTTSSVSLSRSTAPIAAMSATTPVALSL
jgi:hypothetical protein